MKINPIFKVKCTNNHRMHKGIRTHHTFRNLTVGKVYRATFHKDNPLIFVQLLETDHGEIPTRYILADKPPVRRIRGMIRHMGRPGQFRWIRFKKVEDK